MMITFSITSPSIVGWSRCYRGWRLGSLPARPLLVPARDRPPQLKVGDGARQRRQPEREATVDQHGHHRLAGVDTEGDERADHAAVHAADPTRQPQQAHQQADEVRLRAHSERRRGPERLEARPQYADVEGPPADG